MIDLHAKCYSRARPLAIAGSVGCRAFSGASPAPCYSSGSTCKEIPLNNHYHRFLGRCHRSHHLPLQNLLTAVVHGRILAPLRLAQTLGASLASHHLAEEALLLVEAQVLRVIELRGNLQESLQVVHHVHRIPLELLPVDYVQLLRAVVSQPLLQVLRVLAGVQAAVPQIL